MENKGPLIVVLGGWCCGGGLCNGSSDGGGCAMVARVDGDQVEEREGESRGCGDGYRGGWQWEGGYGGESEVAVEVVDERGKIEEESVWLRLELGLGLGLWLESVTLTFINDTSVKMVFIIFNYIFFSVNATMAKKKWVASCICLNLKEREHFEIQEEY